MLLGVNVINEAVDEKVFVETVRIPNQTGVNITSLKKVDQNVR